MQKQMYAERAKKYNEDKERIEADRLAMLPKHKKAKGSASAFILFSKDQRKITMDENPGVRFGEISRTISEKWKQLSDLEKKIYADRAKKYNADKDKVEV